MIGLRHQLAVHSPLSLGALLAAAIPRGRRAVPALEELRQRLAREYDAEAVVLCASGTQALQLAIRHAVGQVGGETAVALPAFCCYDVASAAVGAGVRVGVYDLDPRTLSPDLDSLERLLRRGVRVVVATHLYGIPVRWREVAELAAAFDALLIEDAAQGQGARWEGRPLGSLGAIGVLSFGRGKGWTGGRGGALLLRGSAERVTPFASSPASADLRNLLAVLAQWALGRPAVYGLPKAVPGLALGETIYHPPTAPQPMPASAARLLLQTAAAARAEAEVRARVAAELLGVIDEGAPVRPIRVGPGAEPGYLRLPLVGYRALSGAPPVQRLGIAGSYPIPIAALAALHGHLLSESSCPGAEMLARELFTVPTHSLLSASDRDRLRRVLRSLSRP